MVNTARPSALLNVSPVPLGAGPSLVEKMPAGISTRVPRLGSVKLRHAVSDPAGRRSMNSKTAHAAIDAFDNKPSVGWRRRKVQTGAAPCGGVAVFDMAARPPVLTDAR